MPKFSKKSLERIAECHPDLQKIAHELIKEMDVTVLCGHRGKAEQDEAYRKGNSQLKWPNSKHNKKPSMAIDMAPYPVQWSDLGPWQEMRAKVKKIAARLGIKIRHIKWDYPHTELL